ncbi:MAG: UPF0175 family protein [Caldilinea sp. CFX5]|nr:UPF0175 family protein [Caldilinea sp. CFX5]
MGTAMTLATTNQLAIELYRSGQLSTGSAARLAGVPRSQFFLLLSQHGLSPFGEEPDELEEDLKNANAACSSSITRYPFREI